MLAGTHVVHLCADFLASLLAVFAAAGFLFRTAAGFLLACHSCPPVKVRRSGGGSGWPKTLLLLTLIVWICADKEKGAVCGCALRLPCDYVTRCGSGAWRSLTWKVIWCCGTSASMTT